MTNWLPPYSAEFCRVQGVEVAVVGIKACEGPLDVACKFCATAWFGFPFEKLTDPLFGAESSYWYGPAITWVWVCPRIATWFAG